MITKPELDPQILSHVERFDREMSNPALDIAGMRSQYATIMSDQVPLCAPVPTRDLTIPTRHGDMAARLYKPDSTSPQPLLVYMHGGGFVVGDLDTLNVPLTYIARQSGWAILSLDYKLAPEHLYPIAYEQCEDGLDWAIAHANSLGLGDRFAIGGDSAGGNLTALLALRKYEAMGDKMVWQLLINPVLDFIGVEEGATLSHRQFNNGPILSKDVMEGFNKAYFPDRESMRRSSPSRQTLPARLPDTFIAAAECDPLRDDSVHYAQALNAAGVNAKVVVYKGMCHNFITLSHLCETAKKSLDDIVTEARNVRIKAEAG